MEDDEGVLQIRQLVGRNLKRLREMRNMSQLALAAETDLTNSFINDIENFTRSVSEKTLARFSRTLQVEPYRFFLPDGMPDVGFSGYVEDFQDRLHLIVDDNET